MPWIWRNAETPFEFYFALSSGMNMYASGIYTNVGRHEKETGTFVDKISKDLYFWLRLWRRSIHGKDSKRYYKVCE